MIDASVSREQHHMCQGSRKREPNETQTRLPGWVGTPWPFPALFTFSSHSATPRLQSMECHKYLVVALIHAIYPKLTPNHAIAKTHTTNSKSHCARLIQHILLHHQILRTRCEGDPGSASGTPFPFLPPDPSAGPKTDATRMQKRMQMIPII